jgi:hypothetical protein
MMFERLGYFYKPLGVKKCMDRTCFYSGENELVMNKFPLKALAFYRVKKDFTSERSNDSFKKETVLQFQSSITNVYEEIEMLEFIEWETRTKKVWHVRNSDSSEPLKGWNHFIEEIDRKKVIG